jgi:hypothetical protein
MLYLECSDAFGGHKKIKKNALRLLHRLVPGSIYLVSIKTIGRAEF